MPVVRNLVVDSSVMVKWLNVRDELWLKEAKQLIEDCEKGKVILYAPELAVYEVGNALVYKGLELWELEESLERLYIMPVKWLKTGVEEAKRIGAVALEQRMTFYDATFVGLAVKLGATLVTDNPKHQGKFEGVKVVALKDYK